MSGFQGRRLDLESHPVISLFSVIAFPAVNLHSWGICFSILVLMGESHRDQSECWTWLDGTLILEQCNNSYSSWRGCREWMFLLSSFYYHYHFWHILIFLIVKKQDRTAASCPYDQKEVVEEVTASFQVMVAAHETRCWRRCFIEAERNFWVKRRTRKSSQGFSWWKMLLYSWLALARD